MTHHRKINLSMFRGGEDDEEDDLVIAPKVRLLCASAGLKDYRELIFVAPSRIDGSEEQDIQSWQYEKDQEGP